jgi:preprotein translocase subunit SecF
MIPFIKYRRIYYIFSGTLVLTSVISLLVFGLKLGIDFKGGSILQVEFKERPAISTVQEKLKDLNLGEIVFQPSGDKDLILRMKNIDEGTHQEILKRINDINGGIIEKSFEAIGPTVGQELTSKTKTITILVLLAIIFYVAFAFRKASRPIASWQYGTIAALAAFFHDIFIPLGIFSFLYYAY